MEQRPDYRRAFLAALAIIACGALLYWSYHH